MARHILHGNLTTFFWGQPYGGSQEALLTAPAFLVFGSRLARASRLVPIGLYALATIVVWRVGLRTIGEPAARVAAGLLWIWPPFAVLHTTHQYGFYASEIFYGAVLLLLALRVVERPDRTRASGCSGWCARARVLADLADRADCGRRDPLDDLEAATIPTAPLGGGAARGARGPPLDRLQPQARLGVALPGRRPGPELREAAPSIRVADHARAARAPRDQRRPSEALLLPQLLTYGVLASCALLYVYGAYTTRRSNASLLYVVTALYPFVYAISALTYHVEEPRYVLALSPLLVLLAGQLLWRWRWAALGFAVATVVSVVELHRIEVVLAARVGVTPTRPHTPDLDARSAAARPRLCRVLRRIPARLRDARADHRGGKPIRGCDVPPRKAGAAGRPGRALGAIRSGRRNRRPGRFRVRFGAPSASRPIVPQLTRHGFRRYLLSPFRDLCPTLAAPGGQLRAERAGRQHTRPVHSGLLRHLHPHRPRWDS